MSIQIQQQWKLVHVNGSVLANTKFSNGVSSLVSNSSSGTPLSVLNNSTLEFCLDGDSSHQELLTDTYLMEQVFLVACFEHNSVTFLSWVDSLEPNRWFVWEICFMLEVISKRVINLFIIYTEISLRIERNEKLHEVCSHFSISSKMVEKNKKIF